MAIISCKECGGQVSDTAATCPHCGAAVAKPVAQIVTIEKKSGGVWKWILGIPVGLFILVMVIGSLNPDSPEKAKDRAVYGQCMRDLAGFDRARSSAGVPMAEMCERFRGDYIRKYGSTP